MTSMKNVSAQGGGKQKRKKSQDYSGYRATVMTNKNTLSFVLKRRHPSLYFALSGAKTGSEWVNEWAKECGSSGIWKRTVQELGPIHQRKPTSCSELSLVPSLSLWALLRLQLYTASLNNIQNDEWHGQPRIHHQFLFLRSIHLQ